MNAKRTWENGATKLFGVAQESHANACTVLLEKRKM